MVIITDDTFCRPVSLSYTSQQRRASEAVTNRSRITPFALMLARLTIAALLLVEGVASAAVSSAPADLQEDQLRKQVDDVVNTPVNFCDGAAEAAHLMAELKAIGVLRRTSVPISLGGGVTELSTGRSYCWEIDMRHEAIAHAAEVQIEGKNVLKLKL